MLFEFKQNTLLIFCGSPTYEYARGGAYLEDQHVFDRFRAAQRRGHIVLLVGQREGSVVAAHPLHGRLEVEEALVRDSRCDFRAKTACDWGLVADQQAPCLAHGGLDSGGVPRQQRLQVDQLAGNAVARSHRVHGVLQHTHLRAPPQHSDVLARLHDVSLRQRQRAVPDGHLAHGRAVCRQRGVRQTARRRASAGQGRGAAAAHSQSIFGSRKITGFLSRIAAISSPLAVNGSRGTTTFSPGVCVK